MNQNIVTTPLQNPPKLFTQTIKAHEVATVYYATSFVAFIDMAGTSQGDITYRLGNSGEFSDIADASTGFDLSYVANDITFKNTTNSDVTIKFAIGIGKYNDTRFSVSGEVKIINPNGAVLQVQDIECDAELTRIQQILQSTGSRNGTLSQGFLNIGDNYMVVNNGGVTPIFTPAQNTDGAIIRMMEIAGNAQVGVYADTSPPTAYNDVTKRKVGHYYEATTMKLQNVIIPEGNGLYLSPFYSVYGFIHWDYL